MFHAPDPPCEFTLPLSPGRLIWQLEVLGWDRAELARRLDLSSGKIGNWIRGRSNVPNPVAVWLEMLARTVAATPAPLLWEHDPSISAVRHGHLDEDDLAEVD